MAETEFKWVIIKAITVTILTIINTIGAIFDWFGIKLYKVTKERVYGSLPAPCLEELHSEPVLKLPVDLMIQGLEQDKQLPLFRRFIMVQIFKDLLEKRIEIKKTLKEIPGILDIKLNKPVFLIGMPRTGTTFLLWLLAKDKNMRAPLLWELNKPYPPGPVKDFRKDPRFKESDFVIRLEKWQRKDSAAADAAHPSEAHMPEECLVVLWRSTWQYLNFLGIDTLSAHESWYYTRSKEDMREIYGFYKKQLQMLAWGHPDMDHRHFLMKAHVHLLELESLVEAFPDACLVYTHRSISEIVPSFISLMFKTLSLYGEPDRKKMIKRCIRLLRELTQRTVRVMKKYDSMPGKNPIFTIMYKDLIKDPILWMRKMYDYYGIEWTSETEKGMRDYIANDPKKKKYGKHTYSLSDFGLTNQMLQEEFKDYYEYFKDKTDDVIYANGHVSSNGSVTDDVIYANGHVSSNGSVHSNDSVIHSNGTVYTNGNLLSDKNHYANGSVQANGSL